MAGIAVCNLNSAGGTILPGPNRKVFYNDQPLAVVGCPVAPHGNNPHNSAVMITGNAKVTIDGIPVCVAGSLASCGHTANGQANLSID